MDSFLFSSLAQNYNPQMITFFLDLFMLMDFLFSSLVKKYSKLFLKIDFLPFFFWKEGLIPNAKILQVAYTIF